MNQPPRFGRSDQPAPRPVIVATFAGGRCSRCRNVMHEGDHVTVVGRTRVGRDMWAHYPSCDDYLGQPDDLTEPRGRPLCRGCWTHHHKERPCPT